MLDAPLSLHACSCAPNPFIRLATYVLGVRLGLGGLIGPLIFGLGTHFPLERSPSLGPMT